MKNNSLLTYVLYGLLALILCIAGYYTCQRQKDQKLKKEQDEAELQQTLNRMGYGNADSTAANGSSFVGDSTKPIVNNNGIEEEPTKSATKPTTNTTTTTTTTTKPTVTTTKPTVTAPKLTTVPTKKSVAGPGSGRWAVRAGTFAYMEGARRRLEEVIKLGYTAAEISKTKDGKAAVIVFRSNDKNAAINVVDKLEAKGVDAAVFATNK